MSANVHVIPIIIFTYLLLHYKVKRWNIILVSYISCRIEIIIELFTWFLSVIRSISRRYFLWDFLSYLSFHKHHRDFIVTIFIKRLKECLRFSDLCRVLNEYGPLFKWQTTIYIMQFLSNFYLDYTKKVELRIFLRTSNGFFLKYTRYMYIYRQNSIINVRLSVF